MRSCEERKSEIFARYEQSGMAFMVLFYKTKIRHFSGWAERKPANNPISREHDV